MSRGSLGLTTAFLIVKPALKYREKCFLCSLSMTPFKFLSQHHKQSGYRWNNKLIMDKMKVLDKEPTDLHRKVLEVVHIKLRVAILNCNAGYILLELYLPLLREDTPG